MLLQVSPRMWLAILIAILLTGLVALSGQDRGYVLGMGRMGATDQEISECYFSVGRDAMLSLHPKGEPCHLARELIGRTGVLIFVPD